MLVLCLVAYSLKFPKSELLHRLLDSLPSAGQSSWVYWRVNSWIISDRSKLLGNLGFKTIAERSRIYEVKEFYSVTVHK